MSQQAIFDDPKTRVLAGLIGEAGFRPRRVLVVGCGSGVEAAALAEALRTEVVGIDLRDGFDPRAAAVATLRTGDATRLDFADGSFDFAYSFHALEHIPDYRQALREVRRVLSPAGGWMIGVPNRSRAVGYLGSNDATLREKIVWNVVDWRARLGGRFRNELGAHAGFTSREIGAELGAVFGEVREISAPYYLRCYPRARGLLGAAHRAGLDRWLFPAVYFLGRR